MEIRPEDYQRQEKRQKGPVGVSKGDELHIRFGRV